MNKLSPEKEKTLRASWQAFIEEYPDLHTAVSTSDDFESAESSTVRLVRDLSISSQIACPKNTSEAGVSARGIRGLVKKLVLIVSAPLLRLLFKRQQRFNDSLVCSVYLISSLEQRVKQLEDQVNRLQRCSHE